MFSLAAKDIRRRIEENDLEDLNVIELPPLQRFANDLIKELKGFAMKIIHTQMTEDTDGIFSHRAFYRYDTLRYDYLPAVLAILKTENLTFGEYLDSLVRANFSGFDITMEMEPSCYRFVFQWSSKTPPALQPVGQHSQASHQPPPGMNQS